MYGAPGGQITEEQKKLQEKYTNDTLKTAGIMAGVLWLTPVVFHFVKKQF